MKTTLLSVAFSIFTFAQQPVRQGQINQVSGNGNALVTTTGAQTPNDCVKIDAAGNHVAAGSGCSNGSTYTGTSNQVTVSGSVISLPSALVPPGSVAAVGAVSGSNISASGILPAGTAMVSGGAAGGSLSGTFPNPTIAQWGGRYTRSNTITQVAPYGHAVTTQATGNFGTDFAHTNNWTDTSWIQFGTNYQIRQTGVVTQISFSWGNPTTTNQYTGLYFIICRPSVSTATWSQIPGDCPVVAKSANLFSSLTAGQVNTLTLATPIPVRKGDYYGFESTGTFGTTGAVDNRFHSDSGNCASTNCYIGLTVGTLVPQQFAWNVSWASGTNIAIPVAVSVQSSPVFSMIGDSIIGGNPRWISVSSNIGTSNLDISSDIGFYIQKATGWTYQNMGIASQTTAQIAARITDVTNYHPQIAILEGGVNDASASVSLATFQSNWTTILSSVQSAGIVPVCLLILPWTNGNNTANTLVDSYNAWLNGQCEQYGGYTVDARPYVGQFRSGGTTDNLWDIRPEYMAVADNLQVHFSTLGYQAIARAILDTLGVTTNWNPARKNGVYYAKQQSKSASISSTTASCQSDLPWVTLTPCESGLYRLSVYMSPMTAAATSSVSLTFNYTDTGTPGNSGHAYSLTTSSLDLSSASNNVQASYVIALDGLTAPTWSTTYSGTATYQVYFALERID